MLRENLDLAAGRDVERAPREAREAPLVPVTVAAAHATRRMAPDAVRFALTADEREQFVRNGTLITADRIDLHLGDTEIAQVHHCTCTAIVEIMCFQRKRMRVSVVAHIYVQHGVAENIQGGVRPQVPGNAPRGHEQKMLRRLRWCSR